MKRRTSLIVCLALLAAFRPAFAQGTAFTYQGRLNSGGAPANGSYDLTFTLFATNAGGVPMAGPVTNGATAVSNGLFVATIDFGPGVFTGGSNWLELAVRTNSVGSFTTLVPRQPLTPAPYAISAENATTLSSGAAVGGGAGNLISSNGAVDSFIGGGSVNNIQFNSLDSFIGGGLGNTNLSNAGFSVIGGGQGNQTASGWSVIGGGIENQIGANSAQATIAGGAANNIQTGSYYSFIGAGLSNTNFSNAGYSVIGGGQGNQSASGWSVLGGGYGNVIGGGGIVNATISGGSQNTNNSSFGTVGGGQGNIIPNTGTYSFIGGGEQNTASGFGATVGGGANNTASGAAAVVGGGQNNTTSGNFSFVGGGLYNVARGQNSTVGGGQQNLAGTNYATVGGGIANLARGWGAFVGGGGFDGTTYGANTASGNASVVGGGLNNTASGAWSTVPGGNGDIAGGSYSFAAGQQAQALHQGAFVWADSQSSAFSSTAVDQFNVRAGGGVRFVTGGAGMTLDGQPILAGTVGPGRLSGAYSNAVTFNNAANNFTGSFIGNGTGLTNVNAAALGGLGPANLWQLGGNYVATGQFLGSTNNQPLELHVNGARAARFEPTVNDGNHSNMVNVVNGSLVNYVSNTVYGATISGGGAGNYYGELAHSNVVIADFGTVGGGVGNLAGFVATVAGGERNTASAADATVGGGAANTASAADATVGGGAGNTASGWAATVGGGQQNIASDNYGTVGGGYSNTANTNSATVPGGYFNVAAGQFSLAAGQQAQALYQGDFV